MVKHFVYPMQLRTRLCKYVSKSTLKRGKIAHAVCKVSQRSLERWMTYQEENGIAASMTEINGSKRTGKNYKLKFKHVNYIGNIIKKKPDIYENEIKKILIRKYPYLHKINLSSINRTLNRMNITKKKLWTLSFRYNIEKEALFWWKVKMNATNIYNTYWMDESSYNNKITNRTNGWSKRGERAQFRVLFARGKRYSIIGVCNYQGIVTYQIITRTCNFQVFFEFIVIFLLPILQHNQHIRKFLLLDNCSIHKNEIFINLMKLFNIIVIFLSPYSPHNNPMELHFNSVKTQVKKDYEGARREPLSTLCNIMENLRNCNILNWINRTGYSKYCVM